MQQDNSNANRQPAPPTLPINETSVHGAPAQSNATSYGTSRNEWDQVQGRDIAALLDPRPVIIVGSVGRRDEVGFATIIWATPVSHEPPMVAFSLRARSHTMSCIQLSGHFSLNILPATQEGAFLCEQVGTRTGFQFNKNVVVKHKIVEVEHEKHANTNANGGKFQHQETSNENTSEDTATLIDLFKNNSIIARNIAKRRAENERKNKENKQLIKAKVPVVNMASSYLLCSVCNITEAGDHLLVTGYVESAHTTSPRNSEGLLAPQDVLLCVQHGCYGKVDLLDE